MASAERMNILVSVNDGYVMPLVVMLTSLFETNDASCICVHLARMDLSDESLLMLRSMVEKYGATFEHYDVDGSFFEGYPTASYITGETYLRLLACEYLPKELDRILWLDADLIVQGDLRPLYGVDFEENALAACSHGDEVPASVVEHCAAIGIDPRNYVNAGVLLINLDAWRAIDMRSEIEDVVARYGSLKYADQDLVNIIFKRQILLVDENLFNLRINQELTDELIDLGRSSSCIIHFCGLMKPWMFSDIPLGDIWRAFYKKSPLGNKPLRLITRAGLSRFATHAKDRSTHA